MMSAAPAEKSDNSLNLQEEAEKSLRKPDLQPIDSSGKNELAGAAE